MAPDPRHVRAQTRVAAVAETRARAATASLDGMTPQLQLSGQRVLVTGATGGLGRVIAAEFLAHGAAVALQGRDGTALDALREDLLRAVDGGPSDVPNHLHTIPADLLGGSASEAVHRAAEALDGLTGVVNCAGMQPVASFHDIDAVAFDEMLRLNVGAAHETTRAAATRGCDWVTHIASIEAIRPASGHSHYATSKAALVMHARAAALELAPMRVNAVSPGLIHRDHIDTDWPEGVASWRAQAPLGRLVLPEDVANACLFLATPYASAVTGHNLVVDAGMMTTPGW